MAEGKPLVVSGLSVDFGGHRANDSVDFRALPGLVTGLIGPNGAGKTTLFNAICGLVRPTTGTIHVGDVDITNIKPNQRARHGLARTFQRLEMFTLLTVRENVAVAAKLRQGNAGDAGVEALLERVGLSDVADARVDEIPTGRARLVELARALATNPAVLLLDEPASGQTDEETDVFGALLRDLAAEGITIVLVEHDVRLVMSVCDRIAVLDLGRLIAEGEAEEIRNNPLVLNAYLGTSGAA
ncbi:MAG TPA: ABC transporter ATP-binding protein [Acidimicrobiales bacterium]|nr:ABC transporter ATP-binding protein [Acidimicrobiales bacterium]